MKRKLITTILALALTLSFTVNALANSSYMDSLLEGMGADTSTQPSTTIPSTSTSNTTINSETTRSLIRLKVHWGKQSVGHLFDYGYKPAEEIILPNNHEEFINTFPVEAISLPLDSVFSYFVTIDEKGKRTKIKKITEDADIYIVGKDIKTRVKKTLYKKGKVKLKFNKKSWKYIDGFEVHFQYYNAKMDCYNSKSIDVKTDGKTFTQYTVKKSKLKQLLKKGEYYNIGVKFYYNVEDTSYYNVEETKVYYDPSHAVNGFIYGPEFQIQYKK